MKRETPQAKPSSEGGLSGESIPQPPAIPDHELIRRIGGGSYGEVWLARSVMGTYRAVKIVSRATFEHDRPFEREFAGIKKFEPISRSHEGLVDLLQVGRNDAAGYFYYVMELADAAGVGVDVKRLTSVHGESARPHPGPLPQGEGEWSSAWRQVEALPQSDRRATDVPSPGGEGQGEGGPKSLYPAANFDPLTYSPKTLRALVRGAPQTSTANPQPTTNRLTLDQCIQLGLSLTNALAYLHGQGLVHRDIKPSNIIFVGGVPKLADVGLVTGVDEARSYVGTEGFIPPEGPGSPQADLYSLGILLYVMSTGKSHQDFPEPLADFAGQPDHARWLEFNAVIHKACRAQVHERYQSAERMCDDLELLHVGKSVKQRRVWERRRERSKKAGVAITLVSIVMATFLIAKKEFTRRTAVVKGSVTTFETSGTKDRAAFNAYDMGRFYWEKRTGEGLSNAILRFEEAIRLDTNFARAYAGLADSYDLLDGYGGVRPEEIRHKARAAVFRAVELDPKLAEVQTSLAKYKFEQEWDWAGAEEAYRTALEIDPDYALAHFWYGNYLAAMSRPNDAVREIRRAVELESTSLIFNAILGLNLLYARDYEGALKQLQETVRMDGNFVEAREDIGYTYFLLGRPEEAIVEWEKYHELLGESPTNLVTRRTAFENGGMQAYWRKGKEQLEEKFAGKPLPALGMARFCTLLGETDEAFVWLNQACDERRHYLKYINVDPTFDSLRSDPRFLKLLKRMGLEKTVGNPR